MSVHVSFYTTCACLPLNHMCTNEYPPAQREQQQPVSAQQQPQQQQQQQPKQQQWRDDEEMQEEGGGRNTSSTAEAGFVEWERKARGLKSDLKSDCLKERGKGRKREYSIFMYA